LILIWLMTIFVDLIWLMAINQIKSNHLEHWSWWITEILASSLHLLFSSCSLTSTPRGKLQPRSRKERFWYFGEATSQRQSIMILNPHPCRNYPDRQKRSVWRSLQKFLGQFRGRLPCSSGRISVLISRWRRKPVGFWIM